MSKPYRPRTLLCCSGDQPSDEVEAAYQRGRMAGITEGLMDGLRMAEEEIVPSGLHRLDQYWNVLRVVYERDIEARLRELVSGNEHAALIRSM